MPNVQLLSEVDPLNDTRHKSKRIEFTPTDMVTLLRRSVHGASQDTLVHLFQEELRVAHADARRRGLRLVIRDHAHSHYCVGATVPERPSLRDMVLAVAPVRSVVTVRHPLDSFASLVKNGWVQFLPATLDEYCRRYLKFLDAHEGIRLVRYEDFLHAPDETARALCAELELPYHDLYREAFPAIRLSGDSGRGGETIAAQSRRPEALALADEAAQSQAYARLTERLGYEPAADAAPR
jgi:hypothetical protein